MLSLSQQNKVFDQLKYEIFNFKQLRSLLQSAQHFSIKLNTQTVDSRVFKCNEGQRQRSLSPIFWNSKIFTRDKEVIKPLTYPWRQSAGIFLLAVLLLYTRARAVILLLNHPVIQSFPRQTCVNYKTVA